MLPFGVGGKLKPEAMRRTLCYNFVELVLRNDLKNRLDVGEKMATVLILFTVLELYIGHTIRADETIRDGVIRFQANNCKTNVDNFRMDSKKIIQRNNLFIVAYDSSSQTLE